MEKKIKEPKPIKNINLARKRAAKKEQFYSIAFFDVLGFSTFVHTNGYDAVSSFYDKCVNNLKVEESSKTGISDSDGIIPVPVDGFKNNFLVAQTYGFIEVMNFSDTFLMYQNYLFKSPAFLLRDAFYEPKPIDKMEAGTTYAQIFIAENAIYYSFLNKVMHFFCDAILNGIPLRGSVASGFARIDKYNSVMFGGPIIEAARCEKGQNGIGISFGSSFKNYHPVYHHFFIPYKNHIKEGIEEDDVYTFQLDWPRYWRTHPEFSKHDLKECIQKMNNDSKFSCYYDNACDFVSFSNEHPDWQNEFDWDETKDIKEFISKTKEWLDSFKK